MNFIPLALRIFVADGDPEGLRIVDHSNWSGKALVFPRALLRTSRFILVNCHAPARPFLRPAVQRRGYRHRIQVGARKFGQHPGRHYCVGRGRKVHRSSRLSHVNPEFLKNPIQINHLLSHGCKTLDS